MNICIAHSGLMAYNQHIIKIGKSEQNYRFKTTFSDLNSPSIAFLGVIMAVKCRIRFLFKLLICT